MPRMTVTPVKKAKFGYGPISSFVGGVKQTVKKGVLVMVSCFLLLVLHDVDIFVRLYSPFLGPPPPPPFDSFPLMAVS